MTNKVAYILDIFPALSETFILNEIVTAQKLGVETAVFSRKRPKDNVQHGNLSEFKGEACYWEEPNQIPVQRILAAHVYWVCVAPGRYFKTLFLALRHQKQGVFWFFKTAAYYALSVKKEKPDHIHAHFASLACEYAMLISLLLGVTYTFTAHGWHDIYEYPPADFYLRASKASRVITVSRYNKRYLEDKFSIPERKIEIIHCGINLDLFKANGRKENLPARILSVSRLHPIKGVEYLIQACKILNDAHVNFTCSIIGDGELQGPMLNLINESKLAGKVKLEGAQPIEEVRKRYAESDIYVNSSLCEGLPVTVIEAMASELPVVATRITGIPELIRNELNGYLVEPKDASGLAKGIKALIDDPSERRIMGMLNRGKIKEDFTLEGEVQKLVNVWFYGKN